MNTIIFDFDGVFTDSFSVTLDVIQALHKKFYLPDINEDDLRTLFYGNFWEQHNRYNLNSDDEKLFKKELLIRVENRQEEISFFPGIKNVIEHLTEKGYRMIIISSNKSSAITNKLATIDLENAFTEILGADKPGNKKEKMRSILSRVGENDAVFFVTDTLGDIKEVREFPTTIVAITWGYHPEKLLKQGEPDYIAHTPQELASILSEQIMVK